MAYAEDHLSDNREARELSFITPGKSTPYGKSRVFFCGHPEDHAVYFEPVREWIWKYNRNTAFWYEDPKKGSGLPLEELYVRLSEMNLIVMPVTTKLLTKTNRAVEVILPYAEEKHIPILPLMMEEGLDELFSNIFGNLQYLKPLEKDPTSVPFEQKLEKYIRGVLIGDDQAQLIRDAFDAYIFLSYRKKDRAYAQELMEMIHRNPRFRDIAIWYDEYLVPGENFNETIRHMLEKSDVFGLVVTPSLLEYMDGAPNYVMANEYPAARACGKPILPMEKAATDRTRLEELYPGIPDCASTEADTEAYLTEQLRGVALAENDEDPQHNFLIGLAYLDGIDVEVDSGKALKLITGAAEAGLEEAIRKLVAMYHDGKGVERDYAVSARWQEKLVDVLRKGYESGKYKPEDRSLCSALLDLGDAYYSLGNHKKAGAVYQEMQSIAEQRCEVCGTVEARRDLSISYIKLGDITSALGDLEEAKEWYGSALGIEQRLIQETKLVGRELYVCFIKLGDNESALGKLTKAKEWYESALDIDRLLIEKTGTAEESRELADRSCIYQRLGDNAFDQGKPAEAKEWYESALDIARLLAEETGTVEARFNLCIIYERLGIAAYVQENLTEAKKWYGKGHAINVALAEETGTVKARQGLALSYSHLGDIACDLGELTEAKKWYELSLNINKKLADETGMVDARNHLSCSYGKLGEVDKRIGNNAEAKKNYELCLAISSALAEETGTLEARRNLLYAFYKRGDIEGTLGNLTEAKKWNDQAVAIALALAEETGTVQARSDLALIYQRMGEISCILDDLAEAKKWYRESFAIRRDLAKETKTIQARHNLAISYIKLGDITKEKGDSVKSKCRFRISFFWLRKAAVKRNQVHAKKFYESSLKICRILAEETGTVVSQSVLADSYFKLGELGDMGSMKKAYNIWKKLAEDHPEVSKFKGARDAARDELELFLISTFPTS